MSLHKRCLFTILATVVAFVAIGRLNVRIKGSDVPTTNSRPTVFLPVQSKNAKDLGAGKLPGAGLRTQIDQELPVRQLLH
jgi:hypothetical protein